MRKKIFIGLFILTALAAVVISQTDFMSDFARTKIIEAAKTEMNMNVSIKGIHGNPVAGFTIPGITISRNDGVKLSAEKIYAGISYPSIIQGNPKLSVIKIEGATTSLETINKLVPSDEQTKEDEETDIPVKTVILKDCILKTDYGLLSLKDARVKIDSSHKFEIDLKCAVNSRDIALEGNINKTTGVWRVGNFAAKVGDGTLKLDGAVYPSPDIKIDAQKINIHELSDIIPQLSGYAGIISAACTAHGTSVDNFVSEGKATFDNVVAHGIPLEFIDMSWNVTPEKINVVLNDSRAKNSSLVGKCTFERKHNEIDLELDADNLKFADWDKEFEEQVGALPIMTGQISHLHAKVSGSLDAPKGEITLSPSKIGYKEINITNLAGRASFDGRGTVNLSCSEGKSAISINGTFGLAKKSKIDIAYQINDFQLEKILHSLPTPPEANITGIVSASGHVSGTADNISLAADLSSPCIAIPEAGKIEHIAGSATFTQSDANVRIKKADAEWNGAHIRAEGTINTSVPAEQLDFAGSFSGLEAVRLYELAPALKEQSVRGSASGKFTVKGTASSPVVSSEINYINGYAHQVAIPHANANITYKEQEVIISPLTASIADGRAELELMFDTATKNWDINGKLNGINVAKSGLTDKKISGIASGTFKAASKNGIKWSVNAECDKMAYEKYKMPHLSASLEGTEKEIIIKSAAAKILNGQAEAAGKITMPESGDIMESALELDVKSKKLSVYEALRMFVPNVHSVLGLAAADVSVTGTLGDPHFTAAVHAAPLAYRERIVPMVDASIMGDKKMITVKDIHPNLRRGSIKGFARIFEKNGKWHTDFNINGKDVDVTQFRAYFPDDVKITGNADFSVSGGGALPNIHGHGEFTSDKITCMGVETEKIKIPFQFTPERVTAEGITGIVEHGKLAAGCVYNNGEWGMSIGVASSDLATLFKHVRPDEKGSVTGTGDLKIHAEGHAGRASSVRAVGSVLLKDGSLSEFDVLKKASKVIGTKPLCFRHAKATFSYDGGDITILPGSQASAPDLDPLYSNVMVDGMISHEKKLSLMAMGKVNVRALNSIVGAYDALANFGSSIVAGTADKGEMLQGVLGGLIKGYAKNEFRFVTMNIRGTTDNPTFSNVRITQAQKQTSAKDSIPTSSSDPDENKKNNGQDGGFTFKFKFDIPVGPGGKRQITDTKGNLVGQSIENIINAIEF